MSNENKPWDDLPIKDFKVTLYPKPKTYIVTARTHVEAIKIGVHNWQSDLHLDQEFFREDVTDLTEQASWPEQE